MQEFFPTPVLLIGEGGVLSIELMGITKHMTLESGQMILTALQSCIPASWDRKTPHAMQGHIGLYRLNIRSCQRKTIVSRMWGPPQFQSGGASVVRPLKLCLSGQKGKCYLQVVFLGQQGCMYLTRHCSGSRHCRGGCSAQSDTAKSTSIKHLLRAILESVIP